MTSARLGNGSRDVIIEYTPYSFTYIRDFEDNLTSYILIHYSEGIMKILHTIIALLLLLFLGISSLYAQNNAAFSWGNNYYGQLGDGASTWRLSPAQIGTGTSWASVSGGGYDVNNDNSGMALRRTDIPPFKSAHLRTGLPSSPVECIQLRSKVMAPFGLGGGMVVPNSAMVQLQTDA